ncbi:MAG: APC family permease [Flavobacterium sp.]|nr:MAG: APC family permease [Flavobacterium sp.]
MSQNGHHTKKLGEFAATAICGNDITSSCLYVSALAIAYAGQYAWLSLLMVAGVLYLFRKIYGEAVGALPLNGGAYNILLNTTSKSNASIAACLTILSYMATAVISASEAMHYFAGLVPGIPIFWATFTLMLLFVVLISFGIGESSRVAVIIFTLHILSMLLLIVCGLIYAFTHNLTVLADNFRMPVHGSIPIALFLGFSTAMLGISGFESSANFVEEQEKGVFRKTLRNMWIAVTVINPLMAFALISAIPIQQVAGNEEVLLWYMGNITGGPMLAKLIAIDAVLVLSGAVLTSFVGVAGLMKRMSLDRILPQGLTKMNRRGGPTRILIVFFALCVSVLLITDGQLGPLAGVYTISFLAVMAFFGFGNLLLKVKRSKLPRPEYSRPFVVAFAIFCIFVALYGNVSLHPEYLVVFLKYFVPAIAIILLLLNRQFVLQYLLVVVRSFLESFERSMRISEVVITRKLHRLHSQQFVYFSKADDISLLNKAILYVAQNEITKKLKIVTVVNEDQQVTDEFMADFNALDRAYPEIKLEYVQIEGTFGPELINELCEKWKIPTNFMFISSPGNRVTYRLADLHGVRLIM